jgi:hypothetical protein
MPRADWAIPQVNCVCAMSVPVGGANEEMLGQTCDFAPDRDSRQPTASSTISRQRRRRTLTALWTGKRNRICPQASLKNVGSDDSNSGTVVPHLNYGQVA